jgi:hypothetical protein
MRLANARRALGTELDSSGPRNGANTSTMNAPLSATMSLSFWSMIVLMTIGRRPSWACEALMRSVAARLDFVVDERDAVGIEVGRRRTASARCGRSSRL